MEGIIRLFLIVGELLVVTMNQRTGRTIGLNYFILCVFRLRLLVGSQALVLILRSRGGNDGGRVIEVMGRGLVVGRRRELILNYILMRTILHCLTLQKLIFFLLRTHFLDLTRMVGKHVFMLP